MHALARDQRSVRARRVNRGTRVVLRSEADRRRRERKHLLHGIALLALVGVAGCGGGGSGGSPTIAIQPARQFRLTTHIVGAPAAGKPTKIVFSIQQPDGANLTKFKHGAGPHTGVHVIYRPRRPRRDRPSPSADRGRRHLHRHGRLPARRPVPRRHRRLPAAVDAAAELPALHAAPRRRARTRRRRCRRPRRRRPSTGTASRCTARRTCARSRPRFLSFTVTGPHGAPAKFTPWYRSARARDLLPARVARLLPHARLRARSAELHEPARRREGNGNVLDARQADRRRSRARRRNVAPVSPVPRRRSRADGAVHVAGAMRRGFVLCAIAAASLALPAAAFAHAALLRTTPSASVVVDTPPPQVSLVYSEAVEPRFAIVSVTDADAHSADGRLRRAARRRTPTSSMCRSSTLRQGWYLVVWRVISVDGHPVRGAFTFAVGPNQGPAAAIQDPVALGDRGHARARDCTLGRVSLADDGDRALRLPHRHRAALARTAARADRRVRGRARGRARRGRPPTRFWRRRSSPSARSGRSARSCRSCERRRSGAATSTSSCCSRSSPSPRASCSGSSVPTASGARWPSCSRSAARCSRPPPSCSCRASPATRRRPRRARSRSRSTGCISLRARSGSAASSACSCSGAGCPHHAGSPASPSSCRASRTSRSSR